METKNLNDYLYKTLQIIATDIESIKTDLREIKDYINLQTNRDNTAIKILKQIMEEQGVVTTTTIEKHDILNKQYNDRGDYGRLLDKLIESDSDNINEIRAGTGNKRYIFFKKDIEKVKKMINVKRSNESYRTQVSQVKQANEYDDLKKLFLNYDKETISTEYVKDIMRRKFNIKTEKKQRQMLEDLKKDGIIKGFNWGNICVR